MKTIEIDEQVFAELEKRAVGFNLNANIVLRRLLNIPPGSTQNSAAPRTPTPTPPAVTTLSEFVRTAKFQNHQQAIDRYLLILGWLHEADRARFTKITADFRRGNRAYFATSEKDILARGEGVSARQIPRSPIWALTTLDNRSKRLVLEDLLRTLSYPPGDINIVLAELPDSGIRRGGRRSELVIY